MVYEHSSHNKAQPFWLILDLHYWKTDVALCPEAVRYKTLMHKYVVKFFKKYTLLIMLLLQLSPPSLCSILPTPSLPHSPPIVHVHGSYLQVLWLLHFLYYSYPPPVYFLPTIYATYSLYLSSHSPPPTPLLITLHVISISMVLFLF